MPAKGSAPDPNAGHVLDGLCPRCGLRHGGVYDTIGYLVGEQPHTIVAGGNGTIVAIAIMGHLAGSRQLAQFTSSRPSLMPRVRLTDEERQLS